jgi:hypothetical protein
MDGSVTNADTHEIDGTSFTGAHWQKSSYSNGQANCVEVSMNLPDVVAMRDSKEPEGAMLRVSREEWRGFTVRIMSGDLPSSNIL